MRSSKISDVWVRRGYLQSAAGIAVICCSPDGIGSVIEDGTG